MRGPLGSRRELGEHRPRRGRDRGVEADLTEIELHHQLYAFLNRVARDPVELDFMLGRIVLGTVSSSARAASRSNLTRRDVLVGTKHTQWQRAMRPATERDVLGDLRLLQDGVIVVGVSAKARLQCTSSRGGARWLFSFR